MAEQEYYPLSIDGIELFQIGDTIRSGGNNLSIKDFKTKKGKSKFIGNKLSGQVEKLTISFVCDNAKDVDVMKKIRAIIAKGKCKLSEQNYGDLGEVGIGNHSENKLYTPKNQTIFTIDFYLIDSFDEDIGILYSLALRYGSYTDADIERDLLGEMRAAFDAMQQSIGKVFDLVNNSIFTAESFANNLLDYASSPVDMLYKGINTIYNAKDALVSTLQNAKRKAKNAMGVFDAIDRLGDAPEELWGVLSSFEDLRESASAEDASYPQEVPIFEAKTTYPEATITQNDNENLKRVAGILNTRAFMEDLIFLFNYKFKTDEELKKHLENLDKRLPHILIDKDKIIEIQMAIEEFAKGLDLLEVETVELPENMTIRDFVFQRYGSDENYLQILDLNNINDDFEYSGELKVFKV